MKTSDMNARQRKAFFNILHAANWHIGGLENTISDEGEDSEEGKSATAQLADHDELVKTIYDMALTDIYEEGGVMWGAECESYIKDIRFCGKEWLLERVEKRLKKMGY